MATVQLDRFIGVDRRVPTAPLWVARIHETKRRPFTFFRTAHWVRDQVQTMLSSSTAVLGPDTSRGCSLLVKEINALIVSPSTVTIGCALNGSMQGILREVAAF